MKRILFVLMILFSISSFGQSENGYITLDSREKVYNKVNLLPYLFKKETKEGWKVNIDENNNLVFTVVIDSLKEKKDELFNQALSYFTYHYGNAKNVIQTQDKEAGLIIAKGVFPEQEVAREDFGMGVYNVTEYNASHVIRIDIKDFKVRVIISVSAIELEGSTYSGSSLSDHFNHRREINSIAPIKNYNDTIGLYLQYSAFSPNGEKISQKKYDKYVERGRDRYQKTHDTEIKIFDGVCVDIFSTISSFEQTLRKGNTSTENNNW